MKNYKNKEAGLEFINPPAKFRSYPFWAWNGRLDISRLEEQILCFKKMGFGGFFIHSRPGLETEYFSPDFFSAISFSIKKAKELGMYACIYDEDRWPSGFAGGKVTQIPKYRQRFLILACEDDGIPQFFERETAISEGKPYLIGCYDIKLSEDGYLEDYKIIAPDQKAEFEKYYAYSVTEMPSGRYNLQTYVDVFQREAIKYFTDITHNEYYSRFKDEYGKTIPMMFSDEPRHEPVTFTENKAVLYWSHIFEKSFLNDYGYELALYIPEIVWDKRTHCSKVRYDFYNNASECFKKAFFEQIHNVLSFQGLPYCGHLMLEDELEGQLRWGGDLMRLYPYFDIPGVDMLFDNVELMNIKQAQSIVRQYGKRDMLSEMYGVVGWDIDFKIIKMQGDWQTAFGVSVRVPHLSMYTMKGCAKRDYPASFNYQAPMCRDFSVIENHFARLTEAFSESKNLADIAMLHPMDTVMLEYAMTENKTHKILNLEKRVKKILTALLYSNIDCDFISEANLPFQKIEIDNGIRIGEMKYSAVIIPPITTIRRTTLDVLNEFSASGGRIVFTGDCPKYLDGELSDAPKSIYDKALHIESTDEIIKYFEDIRRVKIEVEGEENKFIHRLSEKDGDYWLFIARCERLGKFSAQRTYTIPKIVRIEINGEYGVTIYDTLSGITEKADYKFENGKTVVYRDWFANDSLLLKLTDKMTEKKKIKPSEIQIGEILFENAELKREEPNCAVLDICSISLNGEEYGEKDYILNHNLMLGEHFDIPNIEVQPYIIKNPKQYLIKAEYEFYADGKIPDVRLVTENPEECRIKFNGEYISSVPDGYYVDKDFLTVPLPNILSGKNILEIRLCVSIVKKLEPMFLIGEFDVHLEGFKITLTRPLERKNAFAPLTEVGMPFYGGNVIYKTEFESPECEAEISVPNFAAPYIKTFIDGEEKGIIAFSPFKLKIRLKAGSHILELVAVGNRNNTFGTIHNKNMAKSEYKASWDCWSGSNCTMDYHLQPVGILKNPKIVFLKPDN